MKIKLKRDNDFIYGFRNFSINVDDSCYALENGQCIELEVTEGDHIIKASIDWCYSNTLHLNGQNSEDRVIVIRNNYLYQVLLVVILLPLAVFLIDSDTNFIALIGIVFSFQVLAILLFNTVWKHKYLLLELSNS
jgi:hypothetical protein